MPGAINVNIAWHSPYDYPSDVAPITGNITFWAVSNSETNYAAAGTADWVTGLTPGTLTLAIIYAATQSFTFSISVEASNGAVIGTVASTTYNLVANVPMNVVVTLGALPAGTTLKKTIFSPGSANVRSILVTAAAAAGAALASALSCSASASMFVPLPGAIYANLFVRSTMPIPGGGGVGGGGLVGGPLNGFYLIPDRGADRTIATSVRTEKFNGNYEQNRVEGINSVSESWSLAFTLRPRAEIELIDALFTSLNGRTSFPWTTPLNELKNFKCVNWDSTYYFEGNASLTCTLEQTFP